MTNSIALSGIEAKARWLRDDAFNLSYYVRQLTVRRSFETNAEAAMAEAEQELAIALERVQQARALYAQLPVNDRAA